MPLGFGAFNHVRHRTRPGPVSWRQVCFSWLGVSHERDGQGPRDDHRGIDQLPSVIIPSSRPPPSPRPPSAPPRRCTPTIRPASPLHAHHPPLGPPSLHAHHPPLSPPSLHARHPPLSLSRRCTPTTQPAPPLHAHHPPPSAPNAPSTRPVPARPPLIAQRAHCGSISILVNPSTGCPHTGRSDHPCSPRALTSGRPDGLASVQTACRPTTTGRPHEGAPQPGSGIRTEIWVPSPGAASKLTVPPTDAIRSMIDREIPSPSGRSPMSNPAQLIQHAQPHHARPDLRPHHGMLNVGVLDHVRQGLA
ncbi:hypothetical protein HD596_000074 [Nonomuraea jabiensis]|uniref:Uncharacterized protein n=1 Tax=Nonomuraea jabiensis TaxID=882448 RepID=A0A7W9FXG5_9ACTN|nr:hypothetical protein [Nonomuraea jabiensis]